MVPDTGPTKDDVEDVIEEAIGDVDFGTDFLNDMLLFFFQEADFLFSGQTIYLVLGDYGTYPIRQLHLVESHLSQRYNSYACLLCDLLDADEIREAHGVNRPSRSGANRKSSSGVPTSFADHTPKDRCRFSLLAAWADHLVIVFEGRHVGPSIELEHIESKYSEKAQLLSRNFDPAGIDDIRADLGLDLSGLDSIDNRVAYSNTQLDLFSMYDKRGRLHWWENRGNLVLEVQKLP